MDIQIPEQLTSQLHSLAAKVGIEPEALVVKAIEQLTSMDAEALLSLVSGDKPADTSALMGMAKSLFSKT